MKTIINTLALAIALSASTTLLLAQEKQGDQKKDTIVVNPDPAIKKAAKKVGNKTAEAAAKGAAAVSDKVYKDKVGPEGQTIYIDGHSKYYYINEKGRKVYVDKSVLKDKPE